MSATVLEGESLSLAKTYRRDGYVVVPGLFDEATRSAAARDIIAVFQCRSKAFGLLPSLGYDQNSLSEMLATLFDKDVESYMAAAKLTQHLTTVHAIGLTPQVMSVLSELGLSLPALSTRPVIHYMADRLKIPGGYQKTPPHQDWRSTQGSLDSVTIWSPLYDVGLEDYPLEIIPGSHWGGLLPTVPDRPNERIEDGQYDPTAFQAVPLRAGDAVIFSGFLVHRTGEQGGDHVRVSFSYRYNNAAEPSFAARNYPNPYLYRADTEIVTPGFASAADVADLFR